MKIEGILLDIDNTLYDYDQAHKKALTSVFDSLAKKHSLNNKKLNTFYQKGRLQINMELSQTASSHNRALYFQRMFEMLDINPLKYTLEYYNLYWDVFLNNLNIYEGVYDFLEFVKDRKICLISDLTADIQHKKIQKMKLFDYAKFLVTSEEAGREKPHPYIFMLALKKLCLDTSKVCMIGDSYEKDIIGATNLAIKSFWSNRRNQESQPNNLIVEFNSFRELKRYFK